MTRKRIKFVTLIRVLFISLFILLVVTGIILQFVVYQRSFAQNAEKLRVEYIAQQKEIVKREVLRVVETIDYHRSLRQQKTRDIVRERVYEAWSIARNIFQQNRSSKTKPEIKKMILEALRPVRFARETGYYFITRLDGVEVLFSDKPELEGTNLLDVQDPNGKFVVRDMIDISKKIGEGFYEYRWTKPKVKGNFYQKIAFIKKFAPYNWFIGAGLYVDDVESETKENLLAEISRVRFGKAGYIFINRFNGDALLTNGKVVKQAIKLWELIGGGEKIKSFFENELVAAAKPDGDYIEYEWGKLKDVNQSKPKISFVCGVPAWNWLVGAGFYVDNVEADIAKMHAVLSHNFRRGLLNKVLIAGVIVVFFILLLHFINRRFIREFDLFATFLREAASGGREIDRGKIRFQELFKVAGDANIMLRDRNAAQERWRELAIVIEQVEEGIAIADLNGTLEFVNHAWALMHGYQSEADLVGRSLAIFHSSEQIAADVKKFNKAVMEKGFHVGEVGHLRQDGTIFPTWMSVTLIKNEAGKPYAYAALAQNITERKAAEDELLRLRKLDSVGILAGGIAHDFNNLLTGLFGNIELARRFISNDHKAYKYLETAGQSLENAAGLTKQLLTFAKGGDPVKEIISIAALVSEAARFSLRGSSLKLDVKVAPDLWSIEADKGQLNQVIGNLVINAQQAMPDGGTITVVAENVTNVDVKLVQVCVQDEGEGIVPDDLGRIFDPYFSTKPKGSGLGLASVYSIVKKHNGTIKVDSKLHEGTVFTIQFPALVAAPEPAAEVISGEESNSGVAGARILVLDDEEIVREVIGEILQALGCKVTYAVDGAAAVTEYREARQKGMPFAVVITDLTIPGGMGGLEATREILKIDPAARIIVSSGYATDPIMTNFTTYGYKGRVEKPYRLEILQKVVEQVLKGD